MTKPLKLFAVAFLAVLSIAAQAASSTVLATGNITTQNLVAGGACTSGGCVEIATTGESSLAMQVTNTHTGALSGQVTLDGSTWITLGSASTFTRQSTGVATATVTSGENDVYAVAFPAGAVKFRVTGLAAMTGTVTITLQTSTASASGVLNVSGGAGDASQAKQDTGNTSLASIDTKTPALGQALAASSTPVVLTAAQITTLTPPAAITGFATSTKQSDGTQKTQVVDGSGNVIGATSNALDVNIKSGASSGAVAQGSTTSGQTGGLTQAAVTTSAPTYTTAQTSPLSLTTGGGLRIAAPSGAFASGSIASGALASGSVASGALASGSVASGAMVDLGAQADTKCAGSSSTCSAIAILKSLLDPNTNLTDIQGPVTAGTATATKANMVGGTYNSTPPTMTNGQQGGLQLSSAGALIVTGSSGATEYVEDAAAAANPQGPMLMGVRRDTLTASEVSADGDNVAAKMTSKGQLHVYADGAVTANLGTIGGASTAAKQPALGTAGTASSDVITVQGIASMTALKVDGSAVTQPVSIATAPVLVAGSAIVGKFGIDQTTPGTTNLVALGANQSMNVAQINGVTPLMGAGNTGTGSPRMTISTDQAALPTHGHGATGSAVPSGATFMGARSGANLVGVIQGDTTVKIDISTATTTQLVALSGSTKTYVTAYSIIAGGTGNIKFVYGTGTNCGTGTTDLTGNFTLVANAGLTQGGGLGPVLVVPASQALCATTSAAVLMGGGLTYTQF